MELILKYSSYPSAVVFFPLKITSLENAKGFISSVKIFCDKKTSCVWNSYSIITNLKSHIFNIIMIKKISLVITFELNTSALTPSQLTSPSLVNTDTRNEPLIWALPLQ